jgi:hypothetical protein
MLTGTEKFVDNLLEFMDSDPSIFLGAVRCLPLAAGVREKIGQVLLSSRIKDLVFGILIADNQLIALLRPRKYVKHTSLASTLSIVIPVLRRSAHEST